MTQQQPIAHLPTVKTVSIQDRSVLVGDLIVVNGYRVNLTALKLRFVRGGGYQVQETSHFLLFTRIEAPSTILVHWFAPSVSSAEIHHSVTQELYVSRILNGIALEMLHQGILDSFEMQDIQTERMVSIGDIAVMNGRGLHRRALKLRLSQSSYQVEETSHFFRCRHEKTGSVLLVHWFAPEDLDTNISSTLVEEFRPVGGIPDMHCLGNFMAGIVGTMFPADVRHAWKHFGANTLQRLLQLTCTAAPAMPADYGTLETFATLYQRVCELATGARFLDAGCNNGYFALLLAERLPFLQEILGVDIDEGAFDASRELARERGLTIVRYLQADLLSEEITQLGSFDTVTALHVLEHFREAEMYRVLHHLLQMTTHRLILAVPYEEIPTRAYDHLQCFSRARLEAVGAWCLEHLGGAGRIWCEDLAGGLLLVERGPGASGGTQAPG